MERERAAKPLLIIVAAPSGTGKTTLCDRLRAEFPGFSYSVSCTTRPPRGAEVDGEDYHFLSVGEFERRVREGRFLEHAVVHGNRYGTLRESVEAAMRSGRHVLMDIDVQGARQIREQARAAGPDALWRRGFVDVFIRPPSLGALRQRLVARGEDAPEAIEGRIRAAETEMASMGEFGYVVVNDDLERAYAELRGILLKEMKSDAR